MTDLATINVSEAKTSELVEFYNEHSQSRAITKFSDRKTAEMRVELLLKVMREEAEDAGLIAPQKEVVEKTDDETPNADRSSAIAKSWTNKETHAKRCQRSAVEVDGVQYGSVNKAFIALGLPSKEHIAFRGILKEAGTTKAYDRTWKIVPLNY